MLDLTGRVTLKVVLYEVLEHGDVIVYKVENGDDKKLETLSYLLDAVGNVLYDIEHKLSELGALTNES